MTIDQKYRRKLDRFLRGEREDAHAQAIRRAVDRSARIQGSQLMPRITMIVSDWYLDEFGNRCRTVRAAK